MSGNVFTPMYKTRNYKTIVTIDNSGNVAYNKNELKQQFLNTGKVLPKYKNIHRDLQEIKKEMIDAVTDFVTKTNEKLAYYRETHGELIAKIWTYSQAFQTARAKYKTTLAELRKELNDLKKSKKNDSKSEDSAGKLNQENDQTTESIKNLEEKIRVINSTLSGLKLMNFEMKSILRSQFGLLTEKTVNNAIASFVVIYNRIFDKIIEKDKENSFRKRIKSKFKDLVDHVYFKRSMSNRIAENNSKNDLRFWINRIKSVNETEKLQIKEIEQEDLEKFEKLVNNVSDDLMNEQKELLTELQKNPELTGEIAKNLMTRFLTNAQNHLAKLDDSEGLPGELLLAAKLKICADLLDLDETTQVWTVFGRANQAKLMAAEGLQIAGKAVPELTKISVTCSVLGTVCSKGFIAMCLMSVFMAGIPAILAGFSITIGSIISISIGKLVGYGLKKGGEYIESEAREPSRELLGINRNSTVKNKETILDEEENNGREEEKNE